MPEKIPGLGFPFGTHCDTMTSLSWLPGQVPAAQNTEREAENMLDCLLTAAERYLKRCKWWDIGLLKICVCAMGVLIGLAVPGRRKRAAAWTASAVFIATYVPLMARFLPDLLGQRTPIEDIYPPDVDLTEDIPKAAP